MMGFVSALVSGRGNRLGRCFTRPCSVADSEKGEDSGYSAIPCKDVCFRAKLDDKPIQWELTEGGFLLTFGSADVNLSLENQVKIWLSIFAQSEDSPSGRLSGEVAELA